MSVSKSPGGSVTRRFAAVGLALGLVFAVGACGRSSGDSSGGGDKGSGDTTDGEMKGGPGIDLKNKTITLGALTPVEGLASVIGTPLTNGNKVFFDQLNAQDGIDGWKIAPLDIVDNKYGTGDSTATATAYGQIREKVAALVQVLGTDPTKSILPQLGDDDMIASPATLDAEWYAEPNLLALMGPYQVQMANGLDYYINKLDGKGKKFCSMSSDDGYGTAGKEGLDFAAEKLDVKIEASAEFAPTDSAFDAQISTLQQAGCEVVFLVSLPNATSSIFNAAESKSFAPQWIGAAPTWVGILAGNKYAQDNYLVVAQGQEWGDESVPGMKEMLDAVKEFAPDTKPDFYFAFGYMQAKAMSQVLAKAIENNDLSRAGILEAMNTVGTLKFDGLVADQVYGPVGEREPSRESTIFKVTGDTTATNGGLTPVADDAVNFTTDVAKEVPLQ